MKIERNSKLKILSIISGDLWAGAENMAFNLLRRLKDHDDLDLSVVLLNEGRLAEELISIGINVHVVDEKINSFRDICRKTIQIIGHTPPNIIHSHRYKENLLALLISGFCRGVKLVSTQHGLPEFHQTKPGINQRIKTFTNFWTLSSFFTTVAVSKDIRNVLISRFGFRRERVDVIYNGIELPTLADACGDKSGPFVIGSSGRLFPVKDYPLMIEIAQAMAATGKEDFRFELAGDGPEQRALEALVQNFGLNACFIFKGHQEDMLPFYRGLDIYLNTSLHEGIPMTILEALSCGLPVIAPAVGGIVEIIENGKEGFLVDSRTPNDFAEKCLFMKNREEYKKMAKAARNKAEQVFSASRMAEGYHQLYRRLTDRYREAFDLN